MMTHRPRADVEVRPVSVSHLLARRPSRVRRSRQLRIRMDDEAARRWLATVGGHRELVLATRAKLAIAVAERPDLLSVRRALALVDRAIALADSERQWHPVFAAVDARHLAAQ